jgi:hypothetical protein
MKREAFTTTPPPSTVVNWEFTRGHDRLSCQIQRNSGSFSVVVMPYRSLPRTTTEMFQKAAAALCRHAALVSDLRASGWKLVSYTA